MVDHATARFNLDYNDASRSLWQPEGWEQRLAGEILYIPPEAPPGLEVKFERQGDWLRAPQGATIHAPNPFKMVAARIAEHRVMNDPSTNTYSSGIVHNGGTAKLYDRALQDYTFRLSTEPRLPGIVHNRANRVVITGDNFVSGMGLCLGEFWSADELARAERLTIDFYLVGTGTWAGTWAAAPGMRINYGPAPMAVGHRTRDRVMVLDTDDTFWDNDHKLECEGTFALSGPFAPWDWLNISERTANLLFGGQSANQAIVISLAYEKVREYARVYAAEDDWVCAEGSGNDYIVMAGFQTPRPTNVTSKATVSARTGGTLYLRGDFRDGFGTDYLHSTALTAAGSMEQDFPATVEPNVLVYTNSANLTVSLIGLLFMETDAPFRLID